MKFIIGMIAAVTLIGGCASKPPPGVPEGSVVVAEGDSVLQFSPKAPGTIVLHDVTQNRPVFMTQLKTADEVIVNIPGRRAVLAGKALNLPITPGPHQLYFKPDAAPQPVRGYQGD